MTGSCPERRGWERLMGQPRMSVAGRRSRAGDTLVEFSLVVWLSLTVLFGAIEFDRMAMVYTALADGARAGLRYAMVHGANVSPASGPGSYAGVQSVVRNFAGTAPVNKGNVTVAVTYPDGNNNPGSRVTLRASYA